MARLFGLLSAFAIVIGLCATPAAAAPSTQKLEPALAAALHDGSTDFMVRFTGRADLTSAAATPGWAERGTAVMDALRATADKAQADARHRLDRAGVIYQAYWVSNVIVVRGGTATVAHELAALDGVERVTATRTYAAPKPAVAPAVQAVEWGIAEIKADQVWSTFGVRGEGAVVGTIDTGAAYDHPALVGSYRGNLGGGVFDHDHNWFDPAGVCPADAPCDNNNHGTHVLGTMVGDDGAGNQIGVAPGARWIAAKGCESAGCSDTSLLASGQWMVAPTDLNGANPRPDLRPHVINNSWGGAGGDPWYQDVVNAWRASGILPAFSMSGSGPGCGTTGSPGDYANVYTTTAYGADGTIAPFAGRGDAEDGKPDIAAPGVGIRSSVVGGYAVYSGTSMASPHTAGAAALIISAAPALAGDVDAVIALLDDGARDVADLRCGGTEDDNPVWGEGKLDALASVTAAPRGPTGVLTGTVRRTDGTPIAGAGVVIDGPAGRTVTTGADGRYTATLTPGRYEVTASAFGFRPRDADARIRVGATTRLDLRLALLPTHRLYGTVRDADGAPLAGLTVTLLDTPLPPVTTSASGRYVLDDVPSGTYQVRVGGDGCIGERTVEVRLGRDRRLDLTADRRADGFGYTCTSGTGGYAEGTTPVALTGDDASTTLALPFGFGFYGATYTQAHVSTNGSLNFLAPSTTFSNGPIPSATVPNAAVYPFWDDLLFDAGSAMFTTGSATSFLVEWRNVTLFGATFARVDFEVELFADGRITFRYRNLDPAQPRELGSSATIGIENAAGTIAMQFSNNAPSLSNQRALTFSPPA